ncbi:MAG TPA: hypothetical protein VGC20_10005, partial [bacterium]
MTAMRWRRPGRIVRRMTLLPAAALLLLAALLGACADEDNVTVQQYDCSKFAAVDGAICGGGVVVASDYQGQGIVLVLQPMDAGLFTWGPAVSDPNAADNIDGRNNTSTFAPDHPAGFYCYTLVLNGRDDWYLPTNQENSAIYAAYTAGLLPGLQAAQYWQSRQNSATAAWTLNYGAGTQQSVTKSVPVLVRCMR